MTKTELPPGLQVREAILTGEWSPGEKLQPTALAKRFDTSTTVVREALTRLVGERLVVTQPNRGFFVKNLELQEFQDITELRCLTDALGAKLAFERGGMEWERELVAAHYELANTRRRDKENPSIMTPEWSRAHRNFHHKILVGCECQPIIELSENLADATELYRRWSTASPASQHRSPEEEHEGLLKAALDRNADLFAVLIRMHYEKTMNTVLEAGLVDWSQNSAN